jgi:amidase
VNLWFRDSTVGEKLRKAGAIILGKANMSQWANYRSSANSSSHGWSATGGQGYGVFYPEQEPGGSSSGSAVVAAIGLAWATLGTDVRANFPAIEAPAI